jgi:hypothetical protein
MWAPFTCEISLVISYEIFSHVKCHMWFYVKSFHMWNVTCNFMWNPFTCEMSHVISCEIFSHVKFHIRSHNFTCYHMISHEITCVNSCGFFVRVICKSRTTLKIKGEKYQGGILRFLILYPIYQIQWISRLNAVFGFKILQSAPLMTIKLKYFTKHGMVTFYNILTIILKISSHHTLRCFNLISLLEQITTDKAIQFW